MHDRLRWLQRFWQIDTFVTLLERATQIPVFIGLVSFVIVWSLSDVTHAALAASALILFAWIGLVLAVLWRRIRNKELGKALFALSVTVLFLIAGVSYLAAMEAGWLDEIGKPEPPWGSDPLSPPVSLIDMFVTMQDRVNLDIITASIFQFRNHYKLVAVLHVPDPTSDPFSDERVQFGEPFEIRRPNVGMSVLYSEEIKQGIRSEQALNVLVCLTPKDVDPSELSTLADLAERGGGILALAGRGDLSPW